MERFELAIRAEFSRWARGVGPIGFLIHGLFYRNTPFRSVPISA